MSASSFVRASRASALVLAASVSAVVVACATSEEQQDLPPPKRPVDAAVLQDTAADTQSDSGSDVRDTGVAMDTSVTDTGTCTPLTTAMRACGKCGTQTRTCSSGGTWNEWSICAGEKTFAACSIGEVYARSCGKCGTQKDTCDPTTCEWVLGTCSMEGVCAAGETDSTAASCPVAGEVRTRTCTDKCAWGAYSECALPKGWVKMEAAPTGFDGRYHHSAVWTGTEMIVWGGYGTYSAPSYVYIKPNGAAYNLGANTWRNIAAPPSALSTGRWQHSAVWTGSKMIVWGGLATTSTSSSSQRNDGAMYDPSDNTWSAIATTTLPARYGHGAVWSTTTNEMLVWGGFGTSCTGSYCGDGAAYDPVMNTWTPIPTAPIAARHKHAMVWTGTEMIVWGGQGTAGYLRDGARYDPKTKVWTKFPDPPLDFDGRIDMAAVWSGKELIVWGGIGNYVSSTYGRSDGARYLPGGSWSRFDVSSDDIFGTGTQAKRYGVAAWFGGGRLHLWSGSLGTSTSSATAQAGGATYDPATDKWTSLDVTAAPTNRARATVVWTGKEAIIFGGASATGGGTYYADGIVYRP